jgi:hypothetical protein
MLHEFLQQFLQRCNIKMKMNVTILKTKNENQSYKLFFEN